MIYNMSGYEKMDFMTFFDVRALKWLQNGPEPKKNYRFLKPKLLAFQSYISCQDMKILIL